MPTSIEPNSEMRANYNIFCGYGEVPGWLLEFGVGRVIVYGLPGGNTTLNKARAMNMAARLDQVIRSNKSSIQDLMTKKSVLSDELC